MKKTRILIVDDEPSIRKFLKANLEAGGYKVFVATNGAEAIELFELEIPDMMILDIMMPVMDGFEVCRRIREWSRVPIIMLSARGDMSDKVKCLDLGADDYMTKPFGNDELIARIRALMRRVEKTNSEPSQPNFTSDNLEINFARRQVTLDGAPVALTPTEYNLLQEMVLNVDKVLTHTHLLNKVWGPEYMDERDYLHVFIRRLRSKIEPDPKNPKYILNIPGVGYLFSNPG
jgi:two-component system KDP operon response regulator KdpE